MCALEKYSKDILSDERWLMRALFISFLNLSLQFSCSVVSNSLRPHGLQNARPPCPSSTPSLLKLMSIESVIPSNHLILFIYQFSSVYSLSRVRLFATPWIAAHQASLSITNSQNSLRLTSIESVMPSNHLILCCPLFLLPPVPPSIRVFSNENLYLSSNLKIKSGNPQTLFFFLITSSQTLRAYTVLLWR